MNTADLQLAESNLSSTGRIAFEILIGADYYWDVVCGDERIITRENYRLLPTIFGYVVSGKVNIPRAGRSKFLSANAIEKVRQKQELLQLVSKLTVSKRELL